MDSITNHPEVLTVIIALPLFGVLARIFGASFRRVAKWYLYVAVFAVVIVMDSMFFPFIGGKDYFFRFSVELSLAFFLLAWAFEMKAGELKELLRNTFRKPLAIAVSAFTGAFLLACLFAYDASAAFWSNYERGEGGFQMIHYYLFFVLLILLLRTDRDWKNIFKFSLVASGLMVLYGIAANFLLPGFIGPYAGTTAPAGFWHKLIDGRFQGSLGNAAYVGAYLIFSMFFAAYLWVRQKEGGNMRTLAHIGYGVLIAIFFFFFVLSQTRGSFLGFGIGILALLIYFVVVGRGRFRKWSAIALAVVVLLGGTAFLVRKSSFVNQFPEGRLLNISLSNSDIQNRFMVWGEAWQGFLVRPVFGWGPANFTTVYDKYFNPGFYSPNTSNETWFDRAHSVYFDYLSETGIIGLLAYLSMFGAFFWEFKKRKRTAGQSPHSRHAAASIVERGLILVLPIAYLVQGIVIFDVLPMYLSLFTFLGFAYYYFYGKYENHGQNR